jgi:hypothetical protein
VRLANALRMRDRKKLVDPTDEDIQDMRAKIGDNLSFARLADANKSDLFCAMLTIRRKLQIYDDLIKSEEEELGPLLSALASLVAAIPNCHGLLTRAVVEMSETYGTTVGERPRSASALRTRIACPKAQRAGDCCRGGEVRRRRSPQPIGEPAAPNNRCAWCGRLETSPGDLSPYGADARGVAWLHPDICWRLWSEKRRVDAVVALREIGIAEPST